MVTQLWFIHNQVIRAFQRMLVGAGGVTESAPHRAHNSETVASMAACFGTLSTRGYGYIG